MNEHQYKLALAERQSKAKVKHYARCLEHQRVGNYGLMRDSLKVYFEAILDSAVYEVDIERFEETLRDLTITSARRNRIGEILDNLKSALSDSQKVIADLKDLVEV
jgi:hypothetical protein